MDEERPSSPVLDDDAILDANVGLRLPSQTHGIIATTSHYYYITTFVLRPFVRDYPGESVPEG